MTAPLVSVITAAYRTEPGLLRNALLSVLNQTHRHFEVIVSDDSPDDRLQGVVEAFQDRRLVYRHNAPALGVAGNHWQCLRGADSDFVAILNHDDTWEPRFIERLIQPLEADPSLALSFCDHWIIGIDGERRKTETEATSQRYGRAELAAGAHRPFFNLLLRQTVPMAMGTLFRRSALCDPLPLDAGPAYDLWLAYLLCRGGRGAWYVPERLSSWRTHPGNLTDQGDIALLRGAARCWATVAGDRNAASIRRGALVRESQAYYACSRWHSRQVQRNLELQYAWRSWTTAANWRALARCALGVLPQSRI